MDAAVYPGAESQRRALNIYIFLLGLIAIEISFCSYLLHFLGCNAAYYIFMVNGLIITPSGTIFLEDFLLPNDHSVESLRVWPCLRFQNINKDCFNGALILYFFAK